MVIRRIYKRKNSYNFQERYLGDREFISFQEVMDYIHTQFGEAEFMDDVICKFIVMDTQEEIAVRVSSIYLDGKYIGNELIGEV